MYIIYGTRLYGKCSHAPGLFYVATTFGHLNWLPLIPTGSYLVFDDGTGENGVQIGFNFVSALLGWFRAACYIAGPLLLIFALIGGPHVESSTRIGQAIAGAGVIVLLILSYFAIRVGRDSAARIAERAGLNPEFVHEHYDRLEGKPVSPHRRDDPSLDEALQRWNPINRP